MWLRDLIFGVNCVECAQKIRGERYPHPGPTAPMPGSFLCGSCREKIDAHNRERTEQEARALQEEKRRREEDAQRIRAEQEARRAQGMRRLDSFVLPTSELEAAAFSDGCYHLISLARDCWVRMWDIGVRREVASFRLDERTSYGYHCVDISQDGRRGIAGGGGSFVVWDAAEGRSLLSLPVPRDVNAVRLSADGRMALVDAAGALFLWDIDSGTMKWKADHSRYLDLDSLAFVNQASSIMAGSERGVHFFDTGRPDEIPLEGDRERNLSSSRLECVVTSRAGGHALSGGSRGDLVLWNTNKRRAVYTFERKYDVIRSVAFSPDGRSALTIGDALRLWGCHSGKMLAEVDVTDDLLGVGFRADGHSAMVVNSDGQVVAWSLGENAKEEPATSLVDPSDSVEHTVLSLVQRVLTDESPEAWKEAHEALSTMDEALLSDARVRQYVPALIERLTHETWYVAASAAEVLAKIGDLRAVEPLVDKALQAHDLGPAQTYLAAVRVLDPSAMASQRGTEKVGVLIGRLKRDIADILNLEWGGRVSAAAMVLGEIGDTRGVAPLIELMAPRDGRFHTTCIEAATALGRLGDPSAVPVLTAAAAHGFTSLKEASLEALDAIRKRNGE